MPIPQFVFIYHFVSIWGLNWSWKDFFFNNLQICSVYHAVSKKYTKYISHGVLSNLLNVQNCQILYI